MLKFLLILVAGVATFDAGADAASAPAPAASAASSPRIASTDEMVLYPGEFYPPELVQAGVQGSATVLATFGADGKVADARIARTSRSPQLDALALSFVRSRIALPAGNGGVPRDVDVPVVFMKDSVRKLVDKTCADFTADVVYFRATFPEKTLRDMPIANMAVGGLLASRSMRDTKQVMALALHSKAPEFEATATACAAHPDDRFFATLSHAIDESIAKDR